MKFDTYPSQQQYSSSNPAPIAPQASPAYSSPGAPAPSAPAPSPQYVPDPFLPPEMLPEAPLIAPFGNDDFSSPEFSFPSLSTIGLIASGVRGGTSSILKNFAKFETTGVEILKCNAVFLEGGKATPVVLLDRAVFRSRPYKYAGRAAGALSIAAIILDFKSIWSQSTFTTGQKWAKTGIYGAGVVASYGAGAGAGLITKNPWWVYSSAVATSVFLEGVKQNLYRKWDLE